MNRWLVTACALVLLLISAVPLGRTLYSSVLTVDVPGEPAEITAEHYGLFVEGVERPDDSGQGVERRSAWTRYKLLGNSLLIGGLGALLAVLIGVPYALLITRTDVPWAEFLRGTYLIPLVLPPLLVTIAWNMAFPPAPLSVQDASDWGGTLAVTRAGALFAACYFPLVVLFTRRALNRVPAALEESARLVGGPWAALRRVTLPLAAPGIVAGALFVFLFSLNDFAVVDLLNWLRVVGNRVEVYPYESFTRWQTDPGGATALGTPLLLIGMALLLVIHRMVGKDMRSSVSGDFRPAAPWQLGRWRYPALVAALVLVIVTVAIPMMALMREAGGIDTYRAAWQRVFGGASQNESLWTLWFAFSAAAVALPLALVLGHHAARTRRLLWMAIAVLPLAVPPVFLGIGYVKLLSSPALDIKLAGVNPLYELEGPQLGTILMLAAKYLPFALIAVWAATLELSPRLEEAARSAGAGMAARLERVIVPLLGQALAVGFVLVFVFCLREIDTLVLLDSKTVLMKIYTSVHFARDNQVAALSVMLVALQALPFVLLFLLAPRAMRSAPAS